ncbi:hypothetical protein [Holdemanella sp.]|uniref:hypothetical protein n=1 Tax=Holdemanella sp. TaxID=1971762 RepID=UPI003AEFF417
MKYINEIKKQKENTINIVLYSVILGVIINIISNALGLILDIKPWIYLVSGIGVSVLLIGLTLIYNIVKLNQTIKYNGAFIVDEKNDNDFITIPNYKISEDMDDYLKSAFCENEAIKNIWQQGNFKTFDFIGVDKDKNLIAKTNESTNMLIELIEYCLLENLSTFIDDYFNLRHMNENVIKLDQNSVPDILLNNRFMKLFSENPRNRSAFVNDSKTKDYEHIVVMTGKNGAVYRRFDLNLPKGSKVYRSNKNTIIIDTKLFTLTIKVLFGGFNTVIENNFYKYYIQKKNKAFSEYQFNIEIGVNYKLKSIFRIMDWKYYNWLDEYIERLEHYCSMDTFYKDINWEQNKTIIRILNTPKCEQQEVTE